jgi:hypothetical protein
MDLKVYYQRIRETREGLAAADVVVVSCETPDGGKAGVIAEVPKELAAKMLVDGTAVLADEDAANEFRRARAAAKEQADRDLAATKIPLTVVPTSELKWLRSSREQS